jgi:hypothetical protein
MQQGNLKAVHLMAAPWLAGYPVHDVLEAWDVLKLSERTARRYPRCAYVGNLHNEDSMLSCQDVAALLLRMRTHAVPSDIRTPLASYHTFSQFGQVCVAALLPAHVDSQQTKSQAFIVQWPHASLVRPLISK